MDRNPVPFAEILRRHFEPSWKMLVELIGRCPDRLWVEVHGGYPFWHQVIHALQDVRYWLQTTDTGRRPDQPIPELGVPSASVLSRREAAHFAEETAILADRFFSSLDERRLEDPSPVNPGVTLADAVLQQIRHVTYHVGHCDSILRDQGLPAAAWSGFGE